MKRKKQFLLAALSALALVMVGCSPGAAPQEPVPPDNPAPSQGTQVGAMAADFQLLGLDGVPVSLSGLRGSPVVVNFWASWCYPCVFEMPHIQGIYEDYTADGLKVLAVNMAESKATVERFMVAGGYSMPVLLDSEGEVARQYGIMSLPTTLFIDRDGIIQSKKIGAFIYREQVEEELALIMPVRPVQ